MLEIFRKLRWEFKNIQYVCRPKESQLSCGINGMHYGQIK